MSKTLKINNRTIKVISPDAQKTVITAEDADMDNRAKNAVSIEPVRIIRKHKDDVSIFPNEYWTEEKILELF